MEFKIEKTYVGEVPLRIMHPFSETKKCIVFYHGWSSEAEKQLSRAVLLCAAGYHVALPEAIHHGEWGALSDYESPDIYETFWETIFQNMEESGLILSYLKEKEYDAPWIMGHSMGGFTTMGVAYLHAKEIAGAVSLNGSGDWTLTHLFMQAAYGIDLGRDWAFYDEIASRNPISFLENYRNLPLCMINGEADTTVDPRAQWHFADELKKLTGNGTRITYPGLAHFVTTNMLDDALGFIKANE